MKKFLFLFCALIMSAVGMKAQEDLQGAYDAAMAAIKDGSTYRVFTEWNGQKYYLTKTGTLASEGAGEPDFFKFVKVAGEEYPFGFKLADAYFSNPPGGGNPTLATEHLETNTRADNNWEAQVFFLQGGKYAVRATNALGGESSWAVNAKTFWTVGEGLDGPLAQYSFDPNFIWQIELYTDVRFDKYDELQGMAKTLQNELGLVQQASQWSSNAPESSEGSFEALLDGEYATFFHSQWSGTGPDEDHYLQAELDEPVTEFYFYFKKRSQNNNNRPTQIDITSSANGVSFGSPITVTEGLPADATPLDYLSAKITLSEPSKYIRFTIPTTNNGAVNNGHVFFTFSEFYILPANEAVEAFAPLMGIPAYNGVYTDLTDEDIAAINSLEEKLAEIEEQKAALEQQKAYEAALASIEDGKTYRIFTEVDGQKYYLDAAGYLVTDAKKAPSFTFSKVEGGEFPYGFNLLDSYFTNPPTGGNPTLKNGHIATDPNSKRKDWEAQVFFLKNGKYAVRATNAAGGDSGWALNARTFWTVNEGPVAEYSFDANYVWQIEEFVDNRPETFAKINTEIVKAWAGKLQTMSGLVTEGAQWISNAIDPTEGSYDALVDGDYATYFHSTWHGGEYDPQADHYLQAELTEATKDFYFYFVKRDPINNANNNNRPTDIIISAGNDAAALANVTEINSGMPTGITPPDYISDKVSMSEANKFIRFTVTKTNNMAKTGDHVFFTFSEFYVLPADELTDAAVPYMKITSYTDLDFDADADAINAAIEALDKRIDEKLAVAEEEKYYNNALAAIESGKTYRIFTEKDGQKFYLNNSGYLVDSDKKAATFPFTAVKANGTLYETGWNLGSKFTNPETYGQTTFENDGHIHVGGNDRDDWERQVFFLNKEGKYAVRATNADNPAWGSNTYWDVFDGAELPEAGYSLVPAYIWQIEEFVDNRPEMYATVQTWAKALQDLEGLVEYESQWTSNAKESSEGSYEALLDGEYTTFFHSQWSGTGPDEDHYLQASLLEPQKEFYFYFKKRSQNNVNRPTQIDITASIDGENFSEPITITEGLPTGATPIDYLSAKITLPEASQYIRFTVPTTDNGATNNGHVFFTFSEFYILPADEVVESAAPFMSAKDYTDLKADDAEAIEAIDKMIKELAEKKALEEEIAKFKVAIEIVQAYVNNTNSYVDNENSAAKATSALTELRNAEYASMEAIEEAEKQLLDIATTFFAGITPLEEIDVTDFFIKNAHPMTMDSWEGDAFGTASNGVCEYWNKSAASFYQNLNLPAGRYKLTAVALTRTGMEAKLFAGKRSTNLVTVGNDIVNNRAQAGAWFDAGNGVNELTFTMKEDGTIQVGLQADKDNPDHWMVWRSFALSMIPEAEKVGYVVSEANDYGHWYRADVEGDSIAYSFAFNNTYKSADEILKLSISNPQTGELLNHANKGVFVLNEGFRINNGGDRDTMSFTLTVPRGYEITDFTLDNSIPGAARGLQKYSLKSDMSDAVVFGADIYELYDGSEEIKEVINQEVGGTRQFTFYMAPILPENGGSVIDVVFTVNVREVDSEPAASTAVKSVKYNGVDVVFDEEGIANMEGTYDAENAIEVELDDENATYEIVVVEDENCVYITVKGADFDYDPQNIEVYVIVFEPAEEPISTAIEGIALTDEQQAVFDLTGRRVSKAKKGVYIINGKKVMVK